MTIKRFRLYVYLLLSLTVTGCASMKNREHMQSFETYLDLGDYEVASDFADAKASEHSNDQILWRIQSGISYFYLGDYEQAIRQLDLAEHSMKDFDLASVGEQARRVATTLLVNDNYNEYRYRYLDAVLVNTYKAWAYLFSGDTDSARIEFNRAEERQRRAVEYFADLIDAQRDALNNESQQLQDTMRSQRFDNSIKDAKLNIGAWAPYEGYVNPFTTLSSALYLSLNATDNPDLSRAESFYERVDDMSGIRFDQDIATMIERHQVTPVIVFIEQGAVVEPREKRFDLPLLTDDYNYRYYGIALPYLPNEQQIGPSVFVNGYDSRVLSDMNRVVSAEFDANFPLVLGREVARSITKSVLQHELEQQDETMGAFFSVYQMASTNADLRSIGIYPRHYRVLLAPPGPRGEVDIEVGNYSEKLRVDRNKTNIVFVKVRTHNSPPMVRVMSL